VTTVEFIHGLSDDVLREIRTLFEAGTAAGLTDAQLLERFAASRAEASEATHAAEAAFAALVARHGPMVLGVCRRVLSRPDDVEDAFQATFLVLVRRAGSIQVGDSLGRWLHGVARRVAAKARVRSEQRRVHLPVSGGEPVVSGFDPIRAELLAALDEELGRLPGKYQAPVVLCHLEGLTHAEAARRLRWPIGTVSGRLSQARTLLHQRLTRRGFSLAVGPLAALLDPEALRVSVPEPLVRSLGRTAARLATEGARPAGASGAVWTLAEGVIKELLMSKLKVGLATLAALGIAVIGAGAWARSGGQDAGNGKTGAAKPSTVSIPEPPRGDQPPATDRTTTPAEAPKPEAGDPSATRLALDVHTQAGAIDKLPRFSYQVRYRHGIVDSMRAIDVSVDRLKDALTAPVLANDWFGWYQTGFSWDEKRFLMELTPGDTVLNFYYQFWTETDAWERREANDKSSVNFVRSAGPARFWKHLNLFDYSYLRLTPHRFWWGQTARSNLQTMSLVPPEKATWRNLGAEKFGGEMCDIIDSSQRTERLWIGRDSGRVRGALTYSPVPVPGKSRKFYEEEAVRRIAGKTFASQTEYSNWMLGEATVDQLIPVHLAWLELNPTSSPSQIRLNELVLFDDYREIVPGVWLPFREVRAFPHASETDRNKRMLRRSELSVEAVKTDLSLADRFAPLLPKEGDPVQDQRFIVPIDLKYRANQADEEIRNLAAAEYDRRLKGQEVMKRLVQPVAAMVGKPAPALPTSGWIGAQPPDLTGKPYLLHFWATWCGPCKNDLPRLKALAKRGATILGMHPTGTSREEVEKVVRDEQLGYPTFLATDKNSDASNPKIAGYSAGVFPYCILVDAQGRVAGHGSLSELLGKFGVSILIAPPKDDAKK
jgi:RNA polymerase sigma factor (sigma-70 family)